ncbi:uncharacterized protein LOC134237060, partial [Saccostrea cucullata]|uniref:uncharacterized protein LOC134237060 n=1 Tax=Saccostrea cuccullata TaxID=36930 RepID=UPI002ED56653
FLVFSQKCKDNRLHYIQEASKTNSFKVSLSLQPIFFTSFDRNHYYAIENRTKTEIAAKIEEKMQQLLDLDYDAGEDMRVKWMKEIKNASKKLYIKFFKDLTELVKNALDVIDDEGQAADEALKTYKAKMDDLVVYVHGRHPPRKSTSSRPRAALPEGIVSTPRAVYLPPIRVHHHRSAGAAGSTAQVALVTAVEVLAPSRTPQLRRCLLLLSPYSLPL